MQEPGSGGGGDVISSDFIADNNTGLGDVCAFRGEARGVCHSQSELSECPLGSREGPGGAHSARRQVCRAETVTDYQSPVTPCPSVKAPPRVFAGQSLVLPCADLKAGLTFFLCIPPWDSLKISEWS